MTASPRPFPGLAFGLGVGPAFFLIITLFARGWVVTSDDSARFSLRSVKICESNDCVVMSNSRLTEIFVAIDEPCTMNGNDYCGGGRAFVIAGWITTIALVFAILGLLLAGFLIVRGLTPDWPIYPTSVAFISLVIAIVSGCVYAASKPGPAKALGIGWTFGVFVVGASVAILGCLLMSRHMAPPIDDWDEGE